MAFGVLQALRERGLTAGHDVSVIGFDDHTVARRVGLTTVRQPVRSHRSHRRARRCSTTSHGLADGRPTTRCRCTLVERCEHRRATLDDVRLQLAKPAEHAASCNWPLDRGAGRLDHRRAAHGDGPAPPRGAHGRGRRASSYVVKELPDDLAEREWRLLRELVDAGLPTAEVVGVVTGRADGADGLLITRHLDYSLPYRVLLSGRGLHIPYLGDRVLDALAGLLVRLHLAGFYWGDCSLSNTLFRRDASALSAYIIDVETGERHATLSDGQRAARPADRHRERRRRPARPADGRAARRRHRSGGDGAGDRDRVRAAVARAHRRRRVQRRSRRSASTSGCDACTTSASTPPSWNW